MPAGPLVIPDTLLVRLIWSLGGTPYAVNVLGAIAPGGFAVNQTTTNTLATAIKARLTSSGLVSRLHTTVALAQVGMRDIRTPNNAEFLDAGAAVVGTGTGDLLPPQLACCVTLRTAKAGKSFRGRVYLCGFTEAASDATGTIATAVRTDALAFVNGIATDMATSTLNFCVASRILSQSNPVILTLIRDAVWDTIRKRAVPGI
jgi:hypothetical protein